MTQYDKRKGQRIAGALVYGGVVAAGMGLGLLTLVSPSGDVEAGERNYVRSAAPDAVAGVRLDEEVTIQFNAAVLAGSVGPDTILIRTGLNSGEQARGSYIVGAFMYDRSAQRRVVIRAEAVQEHFQLIRGLSRADATRRANRVIARIERTGRLRRLARIDRDLANFFGASYGAGTRLDDETTFATYPPRLAPGSRLEGYRRLIAGDDTLHEDYLINGIQAAYDQLAANTEFERFHHPVDPATGIAAASSVLRERQYRRVLIARRNRSRVMFVPDIPIRADLIDSGMQPARAYSLTVPASQPGVFNTVLTRRGRRPLLQSGGRDFSTLFTTIPTTSGQPLYLDNEARTGVATLQKPRIINLTPPNGETFVDPTTDYEDPDDQFSVPLPARRTFTIRIRFAQPLDPRQINTTNFLLTKTEGNVPVAIGTFLSQKRLGIVEVEVTPATNLDPESQYTLVVRGSVASLGGALLGDDKTFSFKVGPGDPPLDRLKESFLNVSNRADPLNDDSIGQITTAFWRAPPLFDPEDSGKLVASFMPFVGAGVGAPFDPTSPSTPIPGSDPPEFTVYDLFVNTGEEITFLTEQLDPLAQNFGDQIEYEYRSVILNGSRALVFGRFPLVIRSQTSIRLSGGAEIGNSGQAGFNGRENMDITFPSATGGIGGLPGSGGYAGGDGAYAPSRAADGTILTGSQGEFVIDPAKLDGSNGFPSFARGGGAGGFSGDHDAPNGFFGQPPTELPEATPERAREAGGGGGHGTVGLDGTGRGATMKLHSAGHQGGLGGTTFGLASMGDQPLNANAVPTMGAGAGGAGGGGGGGEDDVDAIAPPTPPATSIDGSDSGGGGGGGGGGGVHLVARDLIELDNSIIDCRGGKGGDTQNADNTTTGQGAPGGHGAGGSIWLQCLGDIKILNGSTVQTSGGQVTVNNLPRPSVGRCIPDPTDIPAGTKRALDGNGGEGGLGYVRFEDSNGAVEFGLQGQAAQVFGVVSQATFEPGSGGGYPSHPSVPMVVDTSEAYSRWFNSQLDTPTYIALFNSPVDDPTGPDTSFFDPDGFVADMNGEDATPFKVTIEARSAPVDVSRPGRPNLFLATGFRLLEDVSAVSSNRFLQFKVTFEMPRGTYSFHNGAGATATLTPRPFVDCISISIELN